MTKDKYRRLWNRTYEQLAKQDELLARYRRERDEARAEVERLRAALDAIANDPHCLYDMGTPHVSDARHQYKIGIADGHRCAANRARRALEGDDE